MKVALTLVLLMLFSCSKEKQTKTDISIITSTVLDSTNHFGGSFELVGMEPQNLESAIASNSYNKNIRLTGNITKSCAKKGCWMILENEMNSVRVTFKDYGFFVPLGFQNKNVLLEGILKEEVVSEADRKHFAEDEGKSKEEIEAIKGDEKQYTFVASSVLVI